ncbi:hypothetical protein GEMRC1_008822 [Eukaryota sp. GEM-RC1]
MDHEVQSVYSVIVASLQPESHAQAEESINALDKNPAFSLLLCKICENETLPVNHRVAAAVQLFKSISCHYDSAVNNFIAPIIPNDQKPYIRISLLRSIVSDNHILRTNIARSLAKVASLEYPEIWASLPSVLAAGLSPSPQSTPQELQEAFQTPCLTSHPAEKLHFLSHGFAMVTAIIAQDVTETKLSAVLQLLLPALLNALKTRVGFPTPPQTLSDIDLEFVLHILNALSNLLLVATYLVQDPSVLPKGSVPIKQVVGPLIMPWFEIFHSILTQSLVPTTDNLQSVVNHLESGCLAPFIQTVKILTTVVQMFTKELIEGNVLTSLLSAVVNVYTSCSSLNEAVFIHQSEAVEISTRLKDSEGESQNMLTLVDACQSFICSTLFASKSARKHMKVHLPSAMETTILLARIDKHSMNEWIGSIDRYYAQEDEQSFDFTLRISAKMFLTKLAEDMPSMTFKTFTNIAGKLFKQAQDMRGKTDEFQWLVLLEAVFCGYSCIVPNLPERKPIKLPLIGLDLSVL